MIRDWVIAALVTFVGIFPIANPFSTAVVFLTITSDFDDARRREQAKLACVYMAAVLLAFLVAGALIMEFFGISIQGLRIAGGLIVARIGFGMLSPEPQANLSEASRAEAERMEDVAFTPLAMPMLSGPGSIAVTIGMAAEARGVGQYAAIALGIVLVAATSYWVLRASRRVVGFLGTTGMSAMARVMGFLLVCIGIQFVVVGVQELLLSPWFSGPILEALERRD